MPSAVVALLIVVVQGRRDLAGQFLLSRQVRLVHRLLEPKPDQPVQLGQPAGDGLGVVVVAAQRPQQVGHGRLQVEGGRRAFDVFGQYTGHIDVQIADIEGAGLRRPPREKD